MVTTLWRTPGNIIEFIGRAQGNELQSAKLVSFKSPTRIDITSLADFSTTTSLRSSKPSEHQSNFMENKNNNLIDYVEIQIFCFPFKNL